MGSSICFTGFRIAITFADLQFLRNRCCCHHIIVESMQPSDRSWADVLHHVWEDPIWSRSLPCLSCLESRPTNINWLPVFSNIEPSQVLRDRATLQEYKRAQQLTDRVPIKEILREPPNSRLRSRRPFVIEAAQLANLNQTEQETWEQSWIQGGHPDMIS